MGIIAKLLSDLDMNLNKIRKVQVYVWQGNYCSVTEEMSLEQAKSVMQFYAVHGVKCRMEHVKK